MPASLFFSSGKMMEKRGKLTLFVTNRTRLFAPFLLFLALTIWIPEGVSGVETRMESQFERCCDLGKSWASEGLRCEKFTGPVNGVPRVEQGLCLETVDICCVRAYHEKSCEKGKQDARAGLACVQGEGGSKKSPCPSDQQRDCCEACKLGILTGSMGQGCAFKSFAFGKPWDSSFLECCHEASPTTTNSDDTSSTPLFTTDETSSTNFTSSSSIPTDIPTPGLDDICQLMKGLLCSDICVPTSGSFYCKCPDGSVLLEDGKTCRKSDPEDRCKAKNPCSQRCTDTGTGVTCGCNPGFILGDDKRTCSPVSGRFAEPTEDNELMPRCPPGYEYNKTAQVCDDIDECTEGLHSCGNEVCYNQPGGYSCARAPIPVKPTRQSPPIVETPSTGQSCESGKRYVRNRGCLDVDECQEDEEACSSNEQCVNTPGSFTCQCKLGFRRDNLTQACVDINECQLLENDCLPTQRCDNTLGSYNCVRYLPCGTGYTLNAATEICEDDDECVLGTHDCSGGYHCRNTLGSYRCDKNPRSPSGGGVGPKSSPVTAKFFATTPTPIFTSGPRGICPRGFVDGPNGQCVDVDECSRGQNPCARTSLQKCVNTLGSYRCVSRVLCGNGYALDPSSNSHCIDVDECAEGSHECGPGQTCQNRQGGYICECPPGHVDGPNKDCVDIDECSLYGGQSYGGGGICGANSRCENTPGSFRCICEPGFENVANRGPGVCEDVDECARTPGLCQHECVNAWGSYRCACKPGFRLNRDNRSCTDIDECVEFKDNNLCIGICENTPGSYACSCPNGYKLSVDGRTCQDVDECASGRVCRDPSEMCQNTRGSFRCNRIDCPGGYYRDPQRKNRCVRTSLYCPSGDLACFRAPSHYSYNFITFVSMLPIPSSGVLELFTMRGTHLPGSTVQFSMALVDARAPPGVTRATESCFALRRPAPSQAVLVMTQSIPGPQEIELDLSMEIYHNTAFAGSAVAKLFIFVSQYEY